MMGKEMLEAVSRRALVRTHCTQGLKDMYVDYTTYDELRTLTEREVLDRSQIAIVDAVDEELKDV